MKSIKMTCSDRQTARWRETKDKTEDRVQDRDGNDRQTDRQTVRQDKTHKQIAGHIQTERRQTESRTERPNTVTTDTRAALR